MPDRLSAVTSPSCTWRTRPHPCTGRDAGVPGPGQRLRLRPSGHVDPPPDRFRPQYRQRVRWVPGRLANPVWVDDQGISTWRSRAAFGVAIVGNRWSAARTRRRIMSRPLDPTRPLWEVYLVEALQGGRFAILTKTHQSMVDRTAAVDIGQVILDPPPIPADPDVHWNPSQEPSGRNWWPVQSSTR